MVKQALKRLTFHRCTHTCISSQRVSDVKTSLLKLIVLQECISFGATKKKLSVQSFGWSGAGRCWLIKFGVLIWSMVARLAPDKRLAVWSNVNITRAVRHCARSEGEVIIHVGGPRNLLRVISGR